MVKKKSTKRSGSSGRFESDKDDGTEPAKTGKVDTEDTTKLLETLAEGLRKQMETEVDLSHLTLKDELRTMQAMLGIKPEEGEGEGDSQDPPAGINPMQTPAVPVDTYIPLSKRNEKKSFLKRLEKYRTVGGSIDDKLGFNK